MTGYYSAAPLVSVYMPTRNRVELLRRAVDSILSQTYRNVELVVSDDGSADTTPGFLKKLAETDSRVTVLTLENVRNSCLARNLAIERCAGEFVTGCDDDDYFGPDRLQEMMDAARSAISSGCTSPVIYTDFNIVSSVGVARRALPRSVCLRDILHRNCIGSQVLARKAAFLDAGLFDAGMPAWQDHDLWVRMISASGGQAFKAGGASYFVDTSHELPRISVRGKTNIEAAHQRFLNKYKSLLSPSIEMRLLLGKLAYSPSDMGLHHVLRSFRYGHARPALSIYLQKLKGQV